MTAVKQPLILTLCPLILTPKTLKSLKTFLISLFYSANLYKNYFLFIPSGVEERIKSRRKGFLFSSHLPLNTSTAFKLKPVNGKLNNFRAYTQSFLHPGLNSCTHPLKLYNFRSVTFFSIFHFPYPIFHFNTCPLKTMSLQTWFMSFRAWFISFRAWFISFRAWFISFRAESRNAKA